MIETQQQFNPDFLVACVTSEYYSDTVRSYDAPRALLDLLQAGDEQREAAQQHCRDVLAAEGGSDNLAPGDVALFNLMRAAVDGMIVDSAIVGRAKRILREIVHLPEADEESDRDKLDRLITDLKQGENGLTFLIPNEPDFYEKHTAQMFAVLEYALAHKNAFPKGAGIDFTGQFDQPIVDKATPVLRCPLNSDTDVDLAKLQIYEHFVTPWIMRGENSEAIDDPMSEAVREATGATLENEGVEPADHVKWKNELVRMGELFKRYNISLDGQAITLFPERSDKGQTTPAIEFGVARLYIRVDIEPKAVLYRILKKDTWVNPAAAKQLIAGEKIFEIAEPNHYLKTKAVAMTGAKALGFGDCNIYEDELQDLNFFSSKHDHESNFNAIISALAAEYGSDLAKIVGKNEIWFGGKYDNDRSGKAARVGDLALMINLEQPFDKILQDVRELSPDHQEVTKFKQENPNVVVDSHAELKNSFELQLKFVRLVTEAKQRLTEEKYDLSQVEIFPRTDALFASRVEVSSLGIFIGIDASVDAVVDAVKRGMKDYDKITQKQDAYSEVEQLNDQALAENIQHAFGSDIAVVIDREQLPLGRLGRETKNDKEDYNKTVMAVMRLLAGETYSSWLKFYALHNPGFKVTFTAHALAAESEGATLTPQALIIDLNHGRNSLLTTGLITVFRQLETARQGWFVVADQKIKAETGINLTHEDNLKVKNPLEYEQKMRALATALQTIHEDLEDTPVHVSNPSEGKSPVWISDELQLNVSYDAAPGEVLNAIKSRSDVIGLLDKRVWADKAFQLEEEIMEETGIHIISAGSGVPSKQYVKAEPAMRKLATELQDMRQQLSLTTLALDPNPEARPARLDGDTIKVNLLEDPRDIKLLIQANPEIRAKLEKDAEQRLINAIHETIRDIAGITVDNNAKTVSNEEYIKEYTHQTPWQLRLAQELKERKEGRLAQDLKDNGIALTVTRLPDGQVARRVGSRFEVAFLADPSKVCEAIYAQLNDVSGD